MSARTTAELGAALYGDHSAAEPATPAAPQQGDGALHQRSTFELAEALYGTPDPAARPPSATQLRTEAELGEAMYGKPQTATPPAQQDATSEPAKQRTPEELAEAAYPKPPEPVQLDPVPAEVQELRDDVARRMYSAQNTFRDAIPEADEAQRAELAAQGITPEAGRKAMAELREIAADLDLSPADVAKVRQRATLVRETQPDAIAQREAAVDALNREFGNDAKQAWRDARALVARDPRVGRMIESMGLGDDPEVVVMIARIARQQRVAGKLKTR